MSKEPDIDTEGAPGILDRAVAALRDMPIPLGPPPEIQSATLGAIARAASFGSSRGLSRFTTPSALARAAVLACLAAGAAAVCFAVVRHHADDVRGQSGTQVPTTSIDDPKGVAMAGSMVTGEIRFEGNAPPPRLIDFGSSGGTAERHDQPLYDDSLLLNLDDTLQNVVISIVAGLPAGKTYPQPSTPVYLDQTGYSFQPHVLAMQTGQPILLRNSDRVLHNTHSLSIRNQNFNITQAGPDAGTKIPSPREPEVFPVQCDIHPWMKSWFCVFNHPYFGVSLANGTFTLNGLPPGRYRLRAWHERLGTQERDVVVKPGQDETINFVFRLSPVPTSPRAAVREDRWLTAEARRSERDDRRYVYKLHT